MTLKQEYRQFLSDYFEGLEIRKSLFYNWEIGLRFELSTGSSDTEEFFENAVNKATTLVQEVFKPSDNVFLVVNEFRHRRNKIKLTNFFFKQIVDLKKEEIDFTVIKQLYDIGDKFDNWNRALIKVPFDRINYKSLLKAIGNIDFPTRSPRLDNTRYSSMEIYFINIDQKIALNMYDDRGLDIIANNSETLRPIYDKYNSWILDYDRETIEKRMNKNGL